MRDGLRGRLDVLVALLWLAAGCGVWAQGVLVTTIADHVYHADGTGAAGSVLVSWPAFTTVGGASISKGSTAVTLGSGGVLSVSLAPNAGATPSGTYYTVVYHLDDGSTSREYWSVPVSATAVSLSVVRASVLPSSVAMQTVSKQYVDQAIARAALTAVPAATGTASSTNYVLKAGDTMTGALVLPGDPVAALQAATKNYVDTTSAGVQAGLGQKVSTVPAAGQTVTQPAGTQLRVNSLNGTQYAQGALSQSGNDGIANALSGTACASGCAVVADAAYSGTEAVPALTVARTRVTDLRGGTEAQTYFNPQSPNVDATAAQSIAMTETLTAAQRKQGGGGTLDAYGLMIRQNGLAGGNNLFPQNVTSAVPYFKSTYSALQLTGSYNTQGQHVLNNQSQSCYGVGDCLLGGQFLTGSGGIRDNADEGIHPYDIQVSEDTAVFAGTCAVGCTSGSTQVKVAATVGGGTQGEGRFLIDKAAGKVLTAGLLVGSGGAGPHPSALFGGTSFPVSTLFTLASAVLPQSNNMAPGTVTVAIATSGVVSGYATNTAVSPAGAGVACVVDAPGTGSGVATNYEMASFSVLDGTHLQLTLGKPHAGGATVAIGGLCGYGVEQTVDTVAGIRQMFPVVGSTSSTALYYTGSGSSLLGVTGATSAYANVSKSIATLVRAGNVVTLMTSGNVAVDVNGLTLTVSGVTDASFNGSFVVTTTAANQLTYTQTGANASSSGGTVQVLTGGYALYPLAEVTSVLNAANNAVDGTLALGPNTVAWATGDVVEEPHYFQEKVSADTTYVTQYTPRPALTQSAGVQYGGVTGAFLNGWSVTNASPASMYFGNGGTHATPASGLQVQGPWTTSLEMQAGDLYGIFMHCNSHGCGRWDSSYNLLAMQSNVNVDLVNYSPLTSTLQFNMRGTQYSLSPSSLTAGTINTTTLNVTRLNGAQAASASDVGVVQLGPGATNAVLANVASSGAATDVAGLAASAMVDTTNAANITSGVLDPARLPAGMGGGGSCASTVAWSATPTFAVTCTQALFHVALNGNVTGETFTGLAAGQRITLVFQVGATAGYTVAWSSVVHGGFVTSGTSGAAGYTQVGRYLVQQLVVDTDGVTLLNPGAMNE